MNKTEILNIVNEPSKHVQIVKIDGKDSIVYSSKFVELLELIPTMLTKDEVIDILDELYMAIQGMKNPLNREDDGYNQCAVDSMRLIHQKIEQLKGENND